MAWTRRPDPAGPGGRGGPGPLTAARHGAYLAVGAGLLTLVNNRLPGSPLLNRGLLDGVGLAALLIGALQWRATSVRAARVWVVALPLLSFVLVGFSDAYGHVSPYSYALYLVVIFAYVGLSQPPLRSLAYLPAAIVTYVAPLLVSPHHSLAAGIPSISVALPVCVLVAEVVSRAERRSALARARDEHSLAALAESEARYRALVENVAEIVYAGRPGAGGLVPTYHFVSPQIEPLLGYRPEEFTADPQRWAAVIHPDDLPGAAEATGRLLADGRPVSRTYRVRHKLTGTYRWMDDRVVPQVDAAGTLTGFLGIARDVTPEREMAERLTHRALHDHLTGLPNRALLLERLGQALARGARHDRPMAVLNLDLDGFKAVNDTLGHAAGDELLVAVAGRLAEAVRAGDTVARFGGDEFVVLLEEVATAEEAISVAGRIVAALAAPFEIQARPVATSASVGVAVAIAGQTDAAGILAAADAAMYRAKAAGKGRYHLAPAPPRPAATTTVTEPQPAASLLAAPAAPVAVDSFPGA